LPLTVGHPLWVILVDFGMSAAYPLRDNLGNAGRPVLLLMASLWTIQAPKLELRIMRYELSDYAWCDINPMLPNKPRGIPRVDDRRVLNGIFWVLR
jgi:hypothetical protein